MEITIEKVVYPGKSLGRGEDGIAVFADSGLIGERLDVRITKNKKTYKEAKVEKVLSASEKRIIPRCPSFGKCGGCNFQHTGYENQLIIKKTYVDELLSVFKAQISPVIGSPQEWGYRNKMEFSFFGEENSVFLGLHQKGEFNKYLSVPPCYIANEAFISLTEIIRDYAANSGLGIYDKKSNKGFYRHLVLRKGHNTGEIMLNIVTNKSEHISVSFFYDLVQKIKDKCTSLYWTVNSSVSDAVRADELVLLHGKKDIEEKLTIRNKTYSFSISPFSFFQTNTLATEKLYETVLDVFKPEKTDSVLDLYCGTGTIGMVLAPYVKEVLGIDEIRESIENAKINSANNGIGNIGFNALQVEKWIKNAKAENFNSIVLDPPRSGITQKVIDFIGKSSFKKVVYVSCNPSTLARDLKLLKGNLGYNIEKIIPMDMFPQTYHVETVVLLQK